MRGRGPGILAIAMLAGASACHAGVPSPHLPTSLGTTSAGAIEGAVELPERGEGFTRARPGEPTRYGTERLVSALRTALASVDRAFPGTVPTRVGDLSYPFGGRHPRHRSHRAGRDADVIFFALDAQGEPTSPRGWVAFSRYGHGADEGESLFFDEARNWHFVRTLVLDDDAAVQWIFCSRGVKSRLLEYAAANETEPAALLRAAYVLQQPQNAPPHDDHFHVRVYCTPDERTFGCRDVGPRWPWLRPEVESIAGHDGSGLDDASLLAALLDGEDPAR